MYMLHKHYLIGEMDLGQAVQDCTLICTYGQLFDLHCTDDLHQHCQLFIHILLLEEMVI